MPGTVVIKYLEEKVTKKLKTTEVKEGYISSEADNINKASCRDVVGALGTIKIFSCRIL